VKILAKKFSRREDPTKLNISRISLVRKVKVKLQRKPIYWLGQPLRLIKGKNLVEQTAIKI